MKFALPLMAAALFVAAPAQAEIVKYTLEKPHTQILFSVNHLGFSNSTGMFHDFDGTIDYDTANIENSKVDVTIKAASVDMGTKPWDDHVKNADLLNVEKFPDITFKSTSVKKTGENTADITGDLTVLGVTKPVVLKTVQNKVGTHPMKGTAHAGFSATTTFKRSEFGVNYGLPNVGDEVTVRLEVEAHPPAAPAAQ